MPNALDREHTPLDGVLSDSSEISTGDSCVVFKRLVKTIPSVDFTINLTELNRTRVGGFCTFTNYQNGKCMSMKKFIGNYAAFNEWANHRIVGWLQTMDLDLLYAETPSSYTSIDYTLQHILRTQRFWIRFIGGKDLSDFNWAVREREVENIMNELITVSTQMKEEYSAFSENELQEVLHFDRPWAKNDLSRYEYIVHIINHGSFHRGQIVTMARCLGMTEGIVNTDYNMFNTPFTVH